LKEYSPVRIILFVLWTLILFLLIYTGIYNSQENLKEFGKGLPKDDRKEMLEYFSGAISLWLIFIPIIYGIVKRVIAHTKSQAELLAQKSAAEIQALKAQINPHFLFNTLNNLYGNAIVEDSPKTAEGIMQLSSIMRHAVESSKTNTIDIEKEISFLLDYIEIQQMRIPKRDNISITSSLNWDEIPAEITPLILLTFVENAFKFGISFADICFVDIKLNVDNQQLSFVCRNSVIPRIELEPGTGTGVENTIKRLALLYPERHSIQINQTERVYEVFLTINLATQ
jgi:LytS/YehU family sensor histidine kinase